jgi:hypothetical protein
VVEAEPTNGRKPGRRWAAVFGLGALVGLLIGLAVGPTGAALMGFRFPYLRLNVPDSAAAPAPVPAKPYTASVPVAPKPADPPAHPVEVQPAAMGPFKSQPLALPAGRALSIGVFGDSMADGLWAALYRDLRKDGQVDVLRFARNSTGLARYDYVDVQAQTQNQLAQNHVDIAVVMFGTNDGQAILDSGKVYGFGTSDWRATYTGRIDALVKLLRGQGATVYWVGLPKMEKDYFDKRSALLNGIFQERMAALGVPFISTVPETVDVDGRYDAYLAAGGDGHKRLMRAPDGIHMTMAGYLRIAEPVSARIRQDMASAAPAPQPVTAPAPTASAPMAMQYGPGLNGPVETAERP